MQYLKLDYCKNCGYELPDKIKRWTDYCSECYSNGHPFKRCKYV
jgi:hypothetical protein